MSLFVIFCVLSVGLRVVDAAFVRGSNTTTAAMLQSAPSVADALVPPFISNEDYDQVSCVVTASQPCGGSYHLVDGTKLTYSCAIDRYSLRLKYFYAEGIFTPDEVNAPWNAVCTTTDDQCVQYDLHIYMDQWLPDNSAAVCVVKYTHLGDPCPQCMYNPTKKPTTKVKTASPTKAAVPKTANPTNLPCKFRLSPIPYDPRPTVVPAPNKVGKMIGQSAAIHAQPVPFHCCGAYVRRAIESVLNPFPHDSEKLALGVLVCCKLVIVSSLKLKKMAISQSLHL